MAILKKFDELYQQLMEMDVGGVYGDVGGSEGSDIGGSDWYAPGDARIPKVLGGKKKKCKKKKKKGDQNKDCESETVAVQRRVFPNM